MILFPRLRRAREDAELWADAHASAVRMLDNRRARMKHMAAENARLRIKVAELYEEVAVLRYGVDRFAAVTEKLLGVEGQDRDSYTDDQDRDSYTVSAHIGCNHTTAVHDTWGCTLCSCRFPPWLAVEGRPLKVTPADDADATAVLPRFEWSAEDDARAEAAAFGAKWSAEEEATSFLADDDAQRRRADR